ncbi:hypothetical protein GM418_13095 [Maribellus comscasis]|uniref:Putative zinc-finger domain-containing protein n=1 Tax=Maribellus comscasis TaxID=2681766 RepID=A0A6I6K3Q0_9BACT|nr:zf-HC2 domain-containing protein [Maribellus comscasis]QGY44564.1 hypothetical protein GM418_13095 [Maribellus comscasis]
MKCEEVKINLPEYIDKKLDKDTTEKIGIHIQSCESCRELYSELKSFLKFTDSFPEVEPPGDMKEEFLKLVETNDNFKDKRIIQLPDWIKVAAILIIGAGTFIAGYFTGSENTEVAQLQSELNSMKKEVLLAGLKDYSGPQRIEAVHNIKTMGNADDALVNALVYTMNSDKNVNVRLAAINTLSEMMDKNPGIKNELIHSLSLQDNPLLQISLIQVLTESGIKEAKDKIESISKDENTNEQVREYAKSMIKTII